MNLQPPSYEPHILPLANINDTYTIIILYIICTGKQRKQIVLHAQERTRRREGLNLQTPSYEPHILPLANINDTYTIIILYIICTRKQRKQIVLHGQERTQTHNPHCMRLMAYH